MLELRHQALSLPYFCPDINHAFPCQSTLSLAVRKEGKEIDAFQNNLSNRLMLKGPGLNSFFLHFSVAKIYNAPLTSLSWKTEIFRTEGLKPGAFSICHQKADCTNSSAPSPCMEISLFTWSDI